MTTLISDIASRLRSILGFLPKTSSYGLKYAMFGVLNILYTKKLMINILATSDLNWSGVPLK